MSHVVTNGDAAAPVEHLFDVWEVANDPGLSFEAKLDRLFELESEAFDLPYGFLSRIDTDDGTQTIEAAYGSHEGLQPGETCPLSESYCRETIQQNDGVFHVDDALAAGWADDPAYERFGLGTYVGAVVEDESGPYGTLCFASSEPRSAPIDAAERRLLQLLATWASDELRTEAEGLRLEEQSTQTEELARIVSHDLRNPLNIAQGQVQLLEDTIQDAVEQIDTAHERMSTIIEQMLVLARADEPVTERRPVDLRTCAVNAWQMVPAEHATLDVTFESVSVAADETRLRSLFENLFRNAVEHGSTSPESDAGVTVEVGLTETAFYVADDGPGIPAAEHDLIFDPGYSTVSDGTGFGLSIVEQVADAHGWTVRVTEGDGGGARFEVDGVEFESTDA